MKTTGRIRRSLLTALTVGALGSLTLGGCISGSVDQGGWADTGTITYWMWDSGQMPGYQQCAANFERKNPKIKIVIEQVGWDDYWGKLMTGFVGNSAPDVFVDHTGKYADYASRGLIENLDSLVERDGPKLDQYRDGTVDLWTAEDGHLYGLPKDWDTVAMFYNEDMAKDAGLSHEELMNLTWDPKTGGTFEKAMARLTIDKNGVRGDEEGFDPKNVAVYGVGRAGADVSGGVAGQISWSPFTAATGWTYMDKETWGKRYNFNDPRFQEVFDWYRGLITKGYMPPLSQSVTTKAASMMQAGKYATTFDGSWNISTMARLDGVKLNTAAVPAGPDGKHYSMTNSLADSITTSSPRKGAAWKWVKYLASPECQNAVADQAVVFPAITSSLPRAEKAFAATGYDISAFTIPVTEKSTVLYPLSRSSVEISAIMLNTTDKVISFQEGVDEFTVSNDRINKLLTKD